MTKNAFQTALAAHLQASPPPAGLAALFAGWPASDHADLCAQCAHTLQHAGAPPAEWQPWLMLATWGWALDGLHWRARALAAALGIEQDLAPLWPEVTQPPRQPANLAFAQLLGLVPLADPAPEAPEAEEELSADLAWEALPHAFEARDWHWAAQALEGLIEEAREFGGAAEPWDAATSPGYEPLPTGAFALALQAGFPVGFLAEDDRAVFWPALAGRADWPADWVV